MTRTLHPSGASEAAAHTPSRTGFRVWFVVGLALLLVAALVGVFFLGRATKTTAGPKGAASDTIVSLVDDSFAAWNAKDAAALAKVYTADAVIEDVLVPSKFTGLPAIQRMIKAFPGPWTIERAGEVTQNGSYATTTFVNPGSGAVVFFITDGKISHQWIMGPPDSYHGTP
jgi:hypothetical protein